VVQQKQDRLVGFAHNQCYLNRSYSVLPTLYPCPHTFLVTSKSAILRFGKSREAAKDVLKGTDCLHGIPLYAQEFRAAGVERITRLIF
jgi:hypothetical protein